MTAQRSIYALRSRRGWVAVTWDRNRNQVRIDLKAGGSYAYHPVGIGALVQARGDRAGVTYRTLAALREDYPEATRWPEMDCPARLRAEKATAAEVQP